jgi:hypothetical protein
MQTKSILRLLAAGVFVVSSGAFAQNVTVNPGAGTYPDLKSAFDAINAGTHTGAVTVSIIGDTTEAAAPAVLNASGSGAASYTSISITPVGGRSITGAAPAGGPLIDLNGADNVTIDGLNAAGNSLTISNTTVSATSGTSTIRFIGGATGNTITNANVLGSGSMSVATNGGVIFFSTDANTPNGNDNNTISNSRIGPAGAALPTKGIYGNGSATTTAIGNSGIVVNNNDIFDYFGAAVTSAGVATGGGCNTWTITNNRFFQSATRTWTTGANHRAIDIANTTATSGAQGFTITGNTIGYAAANQSGVYALTGSTGKFVGIAFSGITGGAATTISNNTITAVSVTGVTSSGTSTASPLVGILALNGLVTTNGNVIGSQTTTGALTLSTNTTTATDVYGIYNFTVDAWTSTGNSIGGITANNAGASGAFIVFGMRANTGTTLPWTAVNNLVGGSVANSIQNNSTSTAAQVIGMLSSNAISTLRGNTIRNLTAAGGTGTGTGASVIGASFTSTTPNHTIEQNTITALSNTNAAAATTVAGIQYTGGTGNNVIQRNNINALSVASAIGIINGINISGGTNTLRNNFIRLGTDAAGADITVGAAISGINEFLGTNQVLNNSVVIFGSGVGGTANTFAFNGQQTVNTRAFQNNIFVNARGNGAGTGKHYAIRVGGSTQNPPGLTSNFNLMFTSGVGGVFGLFNAVDQADLAAWQLATGQDLNSLSANPEFVAATDLHLNAASPARNAGLVIASVVNDFDGDSRPGTNTLYDIGADEFDGIPAVVNDIAGAAFIDPTGPGVKPANVAFAPQASFVNNGTADQASVTVRYRIVDAGSTEVYNQTTTIGPVASLATVTATFPSATLPVGSYTIFARAELGTDTVPANDQISSTLTVAAPLAGTYTVGTGGDYTTLSAAGGAFQALNALGASADITLNIISDVTTETGANGLNELPAGIDVLIRPTGAARSLSGASATSLIRINGADNVTLDGSLTGGTAGAVVGGDAALRNLTIYNNATAAGTSVVQVASGATGAQNVVLRNLVVLGQDPTTTLLGIAIGGPTSGSVGTDNDNIRVENNAIRRAILGVYNAGASAANPNTGNVITRNDLTGTGTERVRRGGVLGFFHDGIEVSLNAIGGIDSNEGADAYGIALGVQDVTATVVASGGITNALVSRNRIQGITSVNTTGFSAFGIGISGGTGANTVVNNMISGVTAPSTAPDLVSGIFVVGAVGSSTRLHYNSIALTGDRGTVATQSPGFGIAISGADPAVELRNNAVSNTQIASGGGAGAQAYAIGTASTTFANLDTNYNAYFSGGAAAAGFRSGSLAVTAGTTYATLALWQAAVADDANALFADPLYVSDSDLHLQAASPAQNVATPLATVTVDIDGNARSATTPDIGADEFTPPNTPPAITGLPVTRTQGDTPAGTTAIATVTDAETAAASLAVTVNGGATATSNGVTVSGIVVDGSGNVAANIVASCSATSANFTLRVTDAGALFDEDPLAVTVLPNTPPVLAYPSATVFLNQAATVNPSSGPSDNNPPPTLAVQSLGTFTGTAAVAPVTGVVSLGNAGPFGTHTIVIRATDNCGAITDANLSVNVTPATPTSDLSIDKSSSLALAGGGLIQYTLQVGNAGPSAVTGAVVADTLPASLSGATWTCTPSGAGAACPATGSGNINAQVDLANGTSVVFAITANLPASPPGPITNTATVTVPNGTTDPNTANNSDTVTDTLELFANGFEPVAGAGVALRFDPAAPGQVQRIAVPADQLAGFARGAAAVEALSVVVGDSYAVIQVRRIGAALQLRLLTRDAAGWRIDAWQDFDAASRIEFEWSTRNDAAQRTLMTSLLRVSRGG